MKTLPLLIAASLTTPALANAGVEHWTAVSSTAMAITGDIVLSPTRIALAGKTLALAVAADVPAFTSITDGDVPARILRVVRPSSPVLLNGNRLCRATWIVVWRKRAFGQLELNMAVYSGAERPTRESSPDLCGTYMYSKP